MLHLIQFSQSFYRKGNPSVVTMHFKVFDKSFETCTLQITICLVRTNLIVDIEFVLNFIHYISMMIYDKLVGFHKYFM